MFSSPMGYLHFYSLDKVDTYLMTVSPFSSPMGYLHFYSRKRLHNGKSNKRVLVPYGVSTFLFYEDRVGYRFDSMVLVPYGVSTFLFEKLQRNGIRNLFSSPMGYLHFYSAIMSLLGTWAMCSRPLWGIYISIQSISKRIQCFY